jgi:tripartite-type tricarboxylate transporter receptor subunit TctC
MKKTILSAALLFAAATATAQEFPNKPVKMVVAQAAGGAPDIMARVIAEQLQSLWGQPVIVENRSGAAGGIAASFVAKQPSDGHSLLMGSAGIMTIAPQLGGKLPYAPEEFVPLAHIASVPNVLLVSDASGIKSVEAFVQAAQKNPKGVSYASLGSGSTSQVSAEMLSRMASLKSVDVPYKGETAGLTDLIGRNVDFMMAAVPVALPHVQANTLRALAVTSARRATLLPNVPTMAELGFAGYDVTQWYALYAPAGTTAEVQAKIIASVKTVMAKEAIQREIRKLGAEPTADNQQDFPAFERGERKKWGEFLKRDSTVKN